MPDIESVHLRVPADIEQAGPFLSNAASQLQGELDSLQAKIGPAGAIDAKWKADARNDFEKYRAEWHQAASDLFDPEYGVLGVIARAMTANAANYASAEHANTRTWRHGA